MEVTLAPRAPRDSPSDVSGASSRYLRDVCSVVSAVAHARGCDRFEVTRLFVAEPLAPGLHGLRNGSTVGLEEALGLLRRTSAGRGISCVLDAVGLRIECAWDAVVVLTLSDATGVPTSGDAWPHVDVGCRPAPASDEVVARVETPADERFWDAVAAAPARVVLLRERWADGPCGSHWYDVSGVDLWTSRPEVAPRSLLGVVVDPRAGLTPDELDDGFTVVGREGRDGRLRHRELPFGVASPTELARESWEYAVPEADVWTWVAVVPDEDGVVRGVWEVL